MSAEGVHETGGLLLRTPLPPPTTHTYMHTPLTRVGLQRHRVKAGDGGQLLREVAEHLLVALRLLQRGKGVHVRQLGPGDGDHFRGGVQLHGAALGGLVRVWVCGGVRLRRLREARAVGARVQRQRPLPPPPRRAPHP